VCSACKGRLAPAAGGFACRACPRIFPVDGGVADFSGGRYYDNFPGPEVLTPANLAGLANEKEGARIQDYYGPLFENIAARTGRARGAFRVLDSGCGNGDAVGALVEAGFDARGHDLSALRKWQWREKPFRERLVVADGRELPFEDGQFHAVVASGVLEHIGVEEQGGETYRVRPLPDRDAARRTYVAELVRVLAPGGSVFLDCPNGAFPIDFWHGIDPGGARFHSLREGFLPKVAEIRALARSIDSDLVVEPRSPEGRLRFRQVGAHWYGRLFRSPIVALQRWMSTRAFRFLAASPLNPYLVVEVRKPGGRNDGAGKSLAV